MLKGFGNRLMALLLVAAFLMPPLPSRAFAADPVPVVAAEAAGAEGAVQQTPWWDEEFLDWLGPLVQQYLGTNLQNPAVLAGISTLLGVWGGKWLYSVFLSDRYKRQQAKARLQADTSVQQVFQAIAEHGGASLKPIASKAASDLEKVNEHNRACSRFYPLLLKGLAGGLLLAAGGVGYHVAYVKSNKLGKTIDELKAQHAANELRAPMKALDEQEAKKSRQHVDELLSKPMPQLVGALKGHEKSLRANLTANKVATDRGMTEDRNRADVEVALAKLSDTKFLEAVVSDAIINSVPASKDPQAVEVRLRAVLALSKDHPTYQKFLHDTVEDSLHRAMPQFLPRAKVREWVKGATLEAITEKVDEALKPRQVSGR